MGSLNCTLFPLLQNKIIKRSHLTAEIELINTQGSVTVAWVPHLGPFCVIVLTQNQPLGLKKETIKFCDREMEANFSYNQAVVGEL